ncbi:MAG: cyclase [Acidimicrobiia bacterium]
MIVAAIRHPVQDYDKWKAGYDAFPPTTGGGAMFARVNRSVDDPNVVAVVAGFASLDAAKAFLDNPDLKTKMGEAGVIGAPRIELYEEVDVI